MAEEIEEKRFVCVWMEPTYYENVNTECDGSLNDENRGFDNLEREQINELKVKGVLRFEDLVIVRTK